MKFDTQYSENIEISFTNEKITLDQHQLYFLENYLRSKVHKLSIRSGFQLINGKLTFEVTIGKNVKSYHHGIQEIVDYLIILNKNINIATPANVMVKIKRNISFSNSINQQSALHLESYILR